MEFVPLVFIDSVVNMTCTHTYGEFGLQTLSTRWGRSAKARDEKCHGTGLTDVDLKLNLEDCYYSTNIEGLELASWDSERYRLRKLTLIHDDEDPRENDAANTAKVLPLITKMLQKSRYPLPHLCVDVTSYTYSDEIIHALKAIYDAIPAVEHLKVDRYPQDCLSPILKKATEGFQLFESQNHLFLPREDEATVLEGVESGRLTTLFMEFFRPRRRFCKQLLLAIAKRGFHWLVVGRAYKKFVKRTIKDDNRKIRFGECDKIAWRESVFTPYVP